MDKERNNMSKNPFPTLIAQHYPDLVRPESCKGWALALEDGTKFENATPEQIQYAAHAINKHERLVAMLRKLEWCAEHDESEQFLEACPICGQAPKWHASGCELAALLKEEEENRDEH